MLFIGKSFKFESWMDKLLAKYGVNAKIKDMQEVFND